MGNTATEVSTTEIARHFGDYIARVRYGGETLVVLKNNARVAEIRPLRAPACTLRSFLDFWRKSPADPDFANDLEAVCRSDVPPENPWA